MTDRLGTSHTGRELVTIDPYDCPTCGRRVLGRRPHQNTGPCAACLADPDIDTNNHQEQTA